MVKIIQNSIFLKLFLLFVLHILTQSKQWKTHFYTREHTLGPAIWLPSIISNWNLSTDAGLGCDWEERSTSDTWITIICILPTCMLMSVNANQAYLQRNPPTYFCVINQLADNIIAQWERLCPAPVNNCQSLFMCHSAFSWHGSRSIFESSSGVRCVWVTWATALPFQI